MSRPFIPGGPERFAHQKRGLRDLLNRRGVGALIMDPGTGKTATAIDYMGVLALGLGRDEIRVLVVCPLAAVDTWVDQMGKWASPDVNYWAEAVGGTLLHRAETLANRGGQPFVRPLVKGRRYNGVGPRSLHYNKSWGLETKPEGLEVERGPDTVPGPRIVLEVINIDTLTSRSRVGSRSMADVMVEAIRRYSPDLLVVDESHKIKSASGNASRLLARVTPHVPRRIILTGTVMPHGALDVFAQWRFLDPTAFGEMQEDGRRKPATFGRFKDRYAVTGGYLGREVIGYRNLDEMQDIMAERATVVRKEDALDLPGVTDTTIHVELSGREKKSYSEMKKALATDLGRGNLASVGSRLTQMMRLRQITSGHLPDDNGTVHSIGDSKIKTIRSLVNDTLAGESRVVIFCQFTHEINALAKALDVAGTEVMKIQGATPKEERVQLRQRFGSDDPARIVMVAQITTMSLAVNELVTASNAVFGSMTLQRDDYVQAKDRLNRLGQSKPVTFWHVVAPGTVDEVILQAHQDRTNLESAVLKHILDQNGEQ